MAGPNYATVLAALVSLLQDDGRLDGTHITDEPDDPTAEQCPAIQVAFTGFSRTPRRMVNFQYGVGGFDEDLGITIRCTVFSAQSVADAVSQRDDFVQTVQTVLGENPTVGGTTLYAYVTGGTPIGRGDSGSIYAGIDLTLTARVQS
jgi:hypothetical protein